MLPSGNINRAVVKVDAMVPTDQRDELISQVQRGELSPDDAQAEAKRLGLELLRQNPDPDDFDPMNEPYWTLPMAVAWIAYRSPEAVREWWDPYRTECWYWHLRKWRIGFDGPVYAGHFLEQLESATLSSLKLGNKRDEHLNSDDDSEMTITAAINVLHDALSIPLFAATGVDSLTGKRTSIGADLWQDLEFAIHNRRDIVRTKNEEGRGYIRFDHVTVPRDAMKQLWIPRSERWTPELPPAMKPEGRGYMPLYCAAQWIATDGGTIDFDPEDVEKWKPAYAALINHVASGEVAISGVRDGVRETIDGTTFADCQIDYPFQDATFDLLLSETFFVRSFPYLDEERWWRGFDDCFENRWEKRWQRLMVLKSDVARIWPFSTEENQLANVALLPTGAPGRPTLMHIVKAEFSRRCERGEIEENLTSQSKALAEWLRTAHPESRPLTPKTIANNLRGAYRETRNARN